MDIMLEHAFIINKKNNQLFSANRNEEIQFFSLLRDFWVILYITGIITAYLNMKRQALINCEINFN